MPPRLAVAIDTGLAPPASEDGINLISQPGTGAPGREVAVNAAVCDFRIHQAAIKESPL